MHRVNMYVDELINSTDILNTNLYSMIGIAKLSAAILGTSTQLNNLPCIPTTPASLSVTVGAGEIYQLVAIDETEYGGAGGLPADARQILKQGIVLDAANYNCPAPGTPGFSVNYLIQVTLQETDTNGTTRYFYNSDTEDGRPPIAITENQTREDICYISIKTGVPALSGTQLTPTPDPGFVGAYVVTVANGQTTITSGDIALYPGAPFINHVIGDFITQAQADARYVQFAQLQNQQQIYSNDTGTVNAITASFSPAISAYSAGLKLAVKIANSNTDASTFSPDGLTPQTITLTNGSSLTANALVAGMIAEFSYDGTNWQLLNPTAAQGVPTGTMLDFAGGTVPATYLGCDGSAVSRTTYAALFGVIGTTWGIGDGSTTFNLPNFRDKMSVGAGSSYTLGQTGGTSTTSLSIANMPAHNHPGSTVGSTGATGSGSFELVEEAALTVGTFPLNIASQGSGTAFSIMNPFNAVTKIIKI